MLPPVTALRTLARIGVFLRPYRRQVVAAAVALLVAAGAVLAVGQGLKGVIDRGFAAGNAAELDRTLALMLAVIVVMAVATFTRYYFVSWIGERVTADLRRAVFEHLLRLPPGWFELTRTGEVISRVTNDTALLETVIGSSVSMAVRNLLLLVGGLVMLAITSVKLTLLVLAGVPVVVAPILLFGRRVRRLARASQDRIGDVGAYVDEALHEIRTVQAYGHEPEDRRRFGERVEAAFETARARIRQRASLVAAVIVLVFGAIGIILWVGGHDVVAGRISAGQLSAFVFYAVIVAGAVATISEVAGDLQRAAGATERVFELLAIEPGIAVPANPVPLPIPARGTVSFDAVTFRYPSRPDTPALDEFSLEVASGENVALVGPSGAGKTTVFQLLLRFYDPQRGAVRIDGVDLRSADPGRCPRAPRRRAAGPGDLRDERPRERPLWPARRDRGRRARRVRSRVRRRVRRAAAAGLRVAARRAGRAAVRRPAAAAGDRARDPGRSADSSARRGDELARRRERAGGAACARAVDGPAHRPDHRASPRDGAPRGPHRRHGSRADRRPGHARRARRRQSALRAAGVAPVWRRRQPARRRSRAGRASRSTMTGSAALVILPLP